MLSRRKFFRSSVLAATTTSVGFPHLARSADQLQATPGQKPRRIIHLVADGMSMGTLTCADHFSQLVRGRGLTWLELCKRPGAQMAWMNMRSLNSLVTDSSAAASSWGCGTRVINGMVNQLGDETPLKTLYELFKEAGWKRALVSTAEITHATPAGFAACVNDREKGSIIAAQYLEREVDLLLGGGQKFFDAKYRKDKRDLLADFRRAGYVVMDSLTELEAAPANQRWLGTFDRSHLPFMLDQMHNPKTQAKVPTLPAMTRAALKWLEKEPRFILQVEGGRVDHGVHNNDAAAAMREQIAFDEALDLCVEFQKQEPDTLLVITTDHGNANLGLNGMGLEYGQSLWMFAKMQNVRSSFAEMLKPLKRRPAVEPEKTENAEELEKAREKAMTQAEKDREKARKKKEEENVATPTEIVEIIEAGTGYKLPYRKAELLALCLAKRGEAIYDMFKEDVCALGQAMANYLGIAFTGNAHTADYVPLMALGPGAERFRGFIQNTEVFYNYLALADIDFRNPDEPLITAGGPEARDVENTESYKYA